MSSTDEASAGNESSITHSGTHSAPTDEENTMNCFDDNQMRRLHAHESRCVALWQGFPAPGTCRTTDGPAHLRTPLTHRLRYPTSEASISHSLTTVILSPINPAIPRCPRCRAKDVIKKGTRKNSSRSAPALGLQPLLAYVFQSGDQALPLSGQGHHGSDRALHSGLLCPRHHALPRPTFPHDGPGRKPSAAGIRPTSRFAPTTHHPEIGQKIIYMQWKQVLAEASVGITIAILEGDGSEEERA